MGDVPRNKTAIGLLIVILTLLPATTPALAADCPCWVDTVAGVATGFNVGDVSDAEIRTGQTFISPGSGAFTSFRVRVGTSVGSPSGAITWYLAGDNAGQPATAIASGTFTPSQGTYHTVTVSGGPVLSYGGLYWLYFDAGAQSTNNRWQFQGNSGSTYAVGQRVNSTNAASWVGQADDLYLIVSVGDLVAANTATATNTPGPSPTPADTATPTITPSPTGNPLIEATSTTGSYMALERTASFGDLAIFGGLMAVATILFISFSYSYYKDRLGARTNS